MNPLSIKDRPVLQIIEDAEKEGLLVGVSSGATCKAVEEIAKMKVTIDKVIVTILADTGQRYLSVKELFE
jgi:cysteine synthase A